MAYFAQQQDDWQKKQQGGLTQTQGGGLNTMAQTQQQGDTVTPLPRMIDNPAPKQPWYTQQDIGTFKNWAKTRYGRDATDAELADIGANSTDMASAQAYADTLAQRLGWKPPAGTGGGTGGVDDNQALLQKRIKELLGTNTGEVNTNSLEYQSQLGSFRRGQGRAMEQAKRAAVSRGQGQSGATDSVLSQLDLEAAGREGDFISQLAGQQIGRQREDLTNAMRLAQEGGLASEARKLQERLGMADLDLRKYLGKGQLGLGLLGTLLGDSRAKDILGLDYAKLKAMLDQQTLQQLIGGL